MNQPWVYMCSPSWTPLATPSPSHPYGSSQCTSLKLPVSCIEHGLAIRFLYDIIHVSMPFSQIIPPSPSPTESKRLFYTSVSLLLSRIQGYCYHLSKFHIYALVYCNGVFLMEQSFGLCGRGKGWDDLGEWHWNMYNIIYETSHQSRFDARYWMLGAGALGRPRGMVRGGRREEGSGWGTRVYLWQIHFYIRQNQYNIVKLKNKIKKISKLKK